MINFIHIPKNGGSSIAKIVKKHRPQLLGYHKHHVIPFHLAGYNLYILRDPIRRFCSAVNYALEKWSFDKNIKNCIKHGINTPEQFIQCYKNKNHKFHEIVRKEIENIEGKHMIGQMKLIHKYVYTPQVFWIRKKNNIYILFENYNKELSYVLKKIGLNIQIPKINTTKKKDNKLSQDSIDFLRNFYKDDFAFINKIKNISPRKRLLI